MTTDQGKLVLGWEEWLALPDLGLPAIKAKVDTGAKTSALHAHLIEPFGPASSPMVRFAVHPRPGRRDVEIMCSARIIGRRDVTSSNGETETRYVIRTRVMVGGQSWPIEVTLSNRESMSYRMLLGREAIRAGVIVDPTSSFLQQKLSYKPYRKHARLSHVRRPLRIAVLTRRPRTPSNAALARAARTRGHVLELVDVSRLLLELRDADASLRRDGMAIAHYDAVIPRLSARKGPFAAALVRQFELTGSFAINPGDAIERLSHPVTLAQRLAAAGIGMAQALSATEQDFLALDPQTKGQRDRHLVVGGTVVSPVTHHEGAELAAAAARALGLGLAEIDIVLRDGKPAVRSVSGLPTLTRRTDAPDRSAIAAVIALIESKVTSIVRRAPPPDLVEGEPQQAED